MSFETCNITHPYTVCTGHIIDFIWWICLELGRLHLRQPRSPRQVCILNSKCFVVFWQMRKHALTVSPNLTILMTVELHQPAQDLSPDRHSVRDVMTGSKRGLPWKRKTTIKTPKNPAIRSSASETWRKTRRRAGRGRIQSLLKKTRIMPSWAGARRAFPRWWFRLRVPLTLAPAIYKAWPSLAYIVNSSLTHWTPDNLYFSTLDSLLWDLALFQLWAWGIYWLRFPEQVAWITVCQGKALGIRRTPFHFTCRSTCSPHR